MLKKVGLIQFNKIIWILYSGHPTSQFWPWPEYGPNSGQK